MNRKLKPGIPQKEEPGFAQDKINKQNRNQTKQLS